MIDLELQALINDDITDALFVEADSRLPDKKPYELWYEATNKFASYLNHKGINDRYYNDYEFHTWDLADILTAVAIEFTYTNATYADTNREIKRHPIHNEYDCLNFFLEFLSAPNRRSLVETIWLNDEDDPDRYITLEFWGCDLRKMEVSRTANHSIRIEFDDLYDYD